MIEHAILQGRVRHQRNEPHQHSFEYNFDLPMIRLDDIEGFARRSHLLRHNKPGIFAFNRKDFHGPCHQSLDTAIRQTVLESSGRETHGPIILMGMLRHFGHSFNPVSFYLCYNKAETEVEHIVAEITNTPWKQRHCYVLSPEMNKGDKRHHIYQFQKQFHISPFHDMQQQYNWEFIIDNDHLESSMKNIEDGRCVFSANYQGDITPATCKSINSLFYKFPLASLRAIFLIYINALKLRLKNVPFFEHPQYRNNEQ